MALGRYRVGKRSAIEGEVVMVEDPNGPWVLLETVQPAFTAVERALQLSGGWREAIVELEDFCSEPVRLKNMLAAADQIDEWVKQARAVLEEQV